MNKSTPQLAAILESLETRARERGLTDTAWAARAGIRNETLSRLRSRSSCDFATLQALAEAVDARLGVIDDPGASPAAQDRFPDRLDREYEERLLALCASGDLGIQRWRSEGPLFFMAGLAVMVASLADSDRRGLLDLAEALHAGSTRVGVFESWLEGSPVRPSRFLALLAARLRYAA
jgi:DNA-binding phage protein